MYRAAGFRFLPDVIKNLLIINGLMFLAMIALERAGVVDLRETLGLHYFGSEAFRPYQVITYMFMHGSFGHIFMNMLVLWMFGSGIENIWGPKRFLVYYVLTGIGAAFLHYLLVWYSMAPDIALMEGFIANPSAEYLEAMFADFRFNSAVLDRYNLDSGLSDFQNAWRTLAITPGDPAAASLAAEYMGQYLEAYKSAPNVVGASGSIFGILLAFGIMFPNALIYLYFLIPIKAKYLVTGIGAYELWRGLANNPGDNVAHFAHLGGMLFGYLLIRFWKRKSVF